MAVLGWQKNGCKKSGVYTTHVRRWVHKHVLQRKRQTELKSVGEYKITKKGDYVST